ncbi:hypothetical protein PN36_11395 [Candidatus Thiomargarita nelsonii]|uniref:Uncharacterized protein n=1 Tax=Candidatus Thiomargarita nelsonii TaxID=1003181 RepID=A0A0A6PJV4_9GAMM|nr:hypothetical protein PN36_11395 [Candidatus Thiomargarita nelsonii]
MELETFFRHKKAHYETQRVTINREEQQKIWLTGLNQLYAEINDWLSVPIQEQLVIVSYEETTLVEDFVNPYLVKNLCIIVDTESVILKPMGMNVLSAAGRVDMVGEEGTIMLVLLKQETGKYQWHIVIRTKHDKYLPLVKESFTDALAQVMRKDD